MTATSGASACSKATRKVNEDFGSRHAADKGIVMMVPQVLIACGAKTREIGPIST
jgi:hypothetical protein